MSAYDKEFVVPKILVYGADKKHPDVTKNKCPALYTALHVTLTCCRV